MSELQNDDHAYTLRLELVDEPGELLRTLRPIAENGGNLLSIFHERGNVTPRGYIPVEVDVEATPDRFEKIVEALKDAGTNVIQAGTERYSEEFTIILSGHLIDTNLSDTLSQIQATRNATVTDISLSVPQGSTRTSSARFRIAAEAGSTEDVLSVIRDIADEKDLRVIEPLTSGPLA
ncbi:amino acid-binding protein [Halocatena pleomorpha]|uniref:Amino acid-binding protein n=1 Tax=Halocatena pleomorpha TaxID=1785090 RepID=A0A3P3R822_9EURY|nr:amino acid-binding protein [Halocatena pleomorpha]RRJ29514.1 amino acid-binding protein [Halocatena pleomorpha]